MSNVRGVADRAGAQVGPLTGPPVGGFLTTYLSWQWIFWINVPIGVIGVLATKFLPKAEPRTAAYRPRRVLPYLDCVFRGSSSGYR